MKQKWKDARGETLVEVLASILIGALSVALLFTAVTASNSMDKTARETDEKYNIALTNADLQAAPVPDTVIDPAYAMVNVKKAGDAADAGINVPVTFYGGENALSYALASSPSPP